MTASLNATFTLCLSYPQQWIVPSVLTDNLLIASAECMSVCLFVCLFGLSFLLFILIILLVRAGGRAPAFCWRHPTKGSALYRAGSLTGRAASLWSDDEERDPAIAALLQVCPSFFLLIHPANSGCRWQFHKKFHIFELEPPRRRKGRREKRASSSLQKEHRQGK